MDDLSTHALGVLFENMQADDPALRQRAAEQVLDRTGLSKIGREQVRVQQDVTVHEGENREKAAEIVAERLARLAPGAQNGHRAIPGEIVN